MNKYINIENNINKMKNKLFLTILTGLFLISFTSAVGDIGIVKQFDCIDLYNYCPSCSYINLTAIQYPNGSTNTMNLVMEKTENNYKYEFCGTKLLGKHSYTTCGDKEGTESCEDITFEVTPSGFSGTLGFYFLILALSFGIILLGFYMEDAPIVILGSFGLYFVGLYILFFGIDGMKDPTYTWALGIIVLMLAAYISIRSAYELIN